eukprot:353852-Chlamydomonas_euryale.AAC.4
MNPVQSRCLPAEAYLHGCPPPPSMHTRQTGLVLPAHLTEHASSCRAIAHDLATQEHACSICMRGPKRLPLCETEAGWSVYKTCLPRPPVSAYHACLGLGRRDRPRPAALTHVLCKDDPAKVSHEGKREDRPLMHTA